MVPLGAATPVHVVGDLRLGDLPRIAVAQPLVGDFDLPAVADLLVEDAELVADAVADRRTLQRRQRIEIAGGEPSETAVAQARFLLARQNDVEILPELGHRGARRLLEIEVDQVVAQVRSHQEFRREIAGDLRPGVEAGLGGARPAILHPIAHRKRQRAVIVVAARDGGQPPDRVAQMIGDRLPKLGRLQPGAHVGARRRLWCVWAGRRVASHVRYPFRYSGQTQLVISGRSAPCSCACERRCEFRTTAAAWHTRCSVAIGPSQV